MSTLSRAVRPVNLSRVLRDRSETVEMDDDDDTLTDYEKQREANIQRELVNSDTLVSTCSFTSCVYQFNASVCLFFSRRHLHRQPADACSPWPRLR